MGRSIIRLSRPTEDLAHIAPVLSAQTFMLLFFLFFVYCGAVLCCCCCRRTRIALMASLIGPFGGFLASGLKRAYNVKDFGDT